MSIFIRATMVVSFGSIPLLIGSGAPPPIALTPQTMPPTTASAPTLPPAMSGTFDFGLPPPPDVLCGPPPPAGGVAGVP
ncbi:MAG: hypothetical protein AAF928_00490 [Myxococcota bacterium]